MKLYGVWTPDWQVFHDRFLGSLKDDFDLRLTELAWVRGDGSWQSPGMKIANYVLWRKLSNAMEDSPGEVLVLTDLDIEWFAPAKDLMLEALGDQDAVFARESKHELDVRINTGICVFRSTPAIRQLIREYADFLFEKYLIAQESVLGQAELLRRLLQRPDISWGYLPYSFASFACGGQDMQFPETPVCYHANGVPTLADKLAYFDLVRRRIGL